VTKNQWEQIDVATVRCKRHDETFRSGSSCRGCDVATGAPDEQPSTLPQHDATARADRLAGAPVAAVARRKPLPSADDYRHANRVLHIKLTRIAERVSDARKAKNNKVVSRLMSAAKVYGDYMRKTLGDGYAMARDREEVDIVERQEAAVRELRELQQQLQRATEAAMPTPTTTAESEAVH
jgi:hypothetical protein